MLTNYLIIFLIILFMTAILTHPTVCVSGAASGLLVWFNSVLPSLFPFMVLTGILVQTGSLNLLEEKVRQIPLVRKLPVTAVFAAVTGLLCGYPMGIRTVSELKNSGQLNRRQAKVLYSFVNQPGPMFVLGYAMPLCGLSPGEGKNFLIAFYGGVGITALMALTFSATEAYISRIYAKKRTSKTADRSHIQKSTSISDTVAAGTAAAQIQITGAEIHFFAVFEDVLLTSMVTLGKIGGYMMLFSLTAALIKELIPQEPFLCLIFSGLLEMTSGLALVPSAVPAPVSPYFVLIFIAFGGLSVAAQSFSLGNLSAKEQLRYLLWKTIQAVVTVLFYGLLIGHLRP